MSKEKGPRRNAAPQSKAKRIFRLTQMAEALRLARLGKKVLPIQPGSLQKSPLIKRGAHGSTTDVATIRKWWNQWRNASIGVSLDGIVVVDLDPRNGCDIAAFLSEHPDAFGTWSAKTGGGGRHIWFRARKGVRYPGKLSDGVDIKSGAGSYVVAPPSMHFSGKRYEWIAPPWRTNLALAPDWISRGKCKPKTIGSNANGEIPEGERNNHLTSLAGSMRRRGMSADAIEAALLIENSRRCVPPLDDSDVKTIAASVARYEPEKSNTDESAKLEDFWAYLPAHKYLHTPTRDLWPKESVNGAVPWPMFGGKPIAPNAHLDLHRPLHQILWAPGEAQVVEGRILDQGGWVTHAGARGFNLYRPPSQTDGDPAKATRWLDHLRFLYPEEWQHIERWLAFKVQYPGRKVNHALLLGGAQGIGKDTLLEPAKFAVGPWNWSEITPTQMLGRFNGWCKGVIVRLSEARDLGDIDRFAFYEHTKLYIAAPPDVLRVDEKNLREHYIVNVLGLVITTNHRTDCVYLPSDDRRHFVAWSDATKADFDAGYWSSFWNWYLRDGGLGDVAAHLRALDISTFDPTAPPPRTRAFEAIVHAGIPQEDGDLAGLVEALGKPKALTVSDLYVAARKEGMHDVAEFLDDRRQRARIPHALERVGYVSVLNPNAPSRGRWKVGSRYVPIYVDKSLPVRDQVIAARSRERKG